MTGPWLVAATIAVAAFAGGAMSARRRLTAVHERCAEAERRAELLRVIANASRDISSLDPDAVLSAVCRATVQAGFDMAEIDVADDELTTLTPVHATGMPDHHVPQPQPITAGIAGLAYTSGETVVVPSYSDWEGGVAHVRELGILGTCGATPVWTEDGIVVILTVAMHDVREVTDFQKECLLGDHTADDDAMLREADAAMYRAKVHGKSRIELSAELVNRRSAIPS